MKSYAAAPGAHAMVLYSDQELDEKKHTEFEYVRTKIFDEEGLKYAVAEIDDPGSRGTVEELRARTIRPDGSIVEFTGQPVERWKRSIHGFRRVLALTYPAATAGSIVEYRERVRFGLVRHEFAGGITPNDVNWLIIQPRWYQWSARGELFAREERFTLHAAVPDLSTYATLLGIAGGAWHFRTANLPPNTTVNTEQEDTVVCEARDVAPLPAPFGPPQHSVQAEIEDYYTGQKEEKWSEFWGHYGRLEQLREADLLGSLKFAREIVKQSVAKDDKPEAALRKLYARAQQIRNLSYGYEPAEPQWKREPAEDVTADEVLKRGEGHAPGINLALVALARAAKLEAGILLLAPRDMRRFDVRRLDWTQLSQTAVWVNLAGQLMMLDPGVPFVPFGKLPWTIAGASGFRVEKDTVSGVTTPGLVAADAGLRRRAELLLSADGSLRGRMQADFFGQEALELRILARKMGEEERTKLLTERLQGWLPTGSRIESPAAEGWDTDEGPVQARFEVLIPARRDAADDAKVALTPTVAGQANPFQNPEPVREVDFPYPYQERDEVKITLPPGMHLEPVPTLRQARLRVTGEIASAPENGGPAGLRRRQTGTVVPAAYQNFRVEEKDCITVSRSLDVLLTEVSASDYAKLRAFFEQVQQWDTESAVLRAEPADPR